MDAITVMDRIDVSPEMISLIGSGSVGPDIPCADTVAFLIAFGVAEAPPTLCFHARPARKILDADLGNRLILIVKSDACLRILGHPLSLRDGGAYHLPAPLRAIAFTIRDCGLPEGARTPYRLAKSIELLCDILRAHADGAVIPVGADGVLTHADSQRVLAARRLIDERWSEKLTLDMIARSCGLNRAKLTRGFRDMFDCSVADAISDQRLGEAGQMLIATDLPVSSIGYKCGYLNNASFTRAFARRFGLAPTQYRAHRLAA
ncbi:helix-turn-helix transcriptional regulator [Sphingobium phenoxybenzoativorans]|uniref:Helix-turn-helix transcriptional regulator n=1 Tax=Sphingobium phenoxybenzoativorans TaxID=1592790 RepID=A0A975K818_9SPHN|nr:AraC family transcriptional regulator [Sphingobium phenoxybenzoativorans]QUT06511.1 helix-turn-helix transcriptional regulator [Sphingobium phenoxybenzoativorans]